MNDKKYQVFISSTYKDLEKARDSIIKAVLELYHIPIGMEMFSAEDEDQWEIIRRTIETSDYYILILGQRYGTKTKEGISFTQKEYEFALEINIPILAFVLDESVPLGPTERDSNVEDVNAFRQTVLKNTKMAQFWKNIDELTKKVSISLMKQIMQKPGTGWVRGDQQISQEVSQELTSLSRENRELRDTIKKLELEITPKSPKIDIELSPLLINCDAGEYTQIYLPEKTSIENYRDIPLSQVTEADVNEYNNNLPTQEQVDSYNIEAELMHKIDNHSYPLTLNIKNTGTTKANNIFVELTFPNDIHIFNKSNVYKRPKNPIPIGPVEAARKKIYDSVLSHHPSVLGTLGQFSPSIIPPISLRRQTRWSKLEGKKITFKLDELLHTRAYKFEDEYLITPLKKGKHEIIINIICEEYAASDQSIINIVVSCD